MQGELVNNLTTEFFVLKICMLFWLRKLHLVTSPCVVFFEQGDLRRMWSEPFHTKSSSSRFLEVWCCSDQHRFPPAHHPPERKRERGLKRGTELVFSSSLIPVVILQPADEQPYADFTARWIHALLTSPHSSFIRFSPDPLESFAVFHYLFPASIPSLSFRHLPRFAQPHFSGSVGRDWSRFELHFYRSATDLQTEICLFTHSANEERGFRRSARRRWPNKGPAHSGGQRCFSNSSFLRSLFLFLIKRHPHQPPPTLLTNPPPFAETCILFRKILFLAYTEMMHYKLSGRTALCIYVYTCIRGCHVEVQVCVYVCACE